MSKLDELIQEYCPNGVEYKKLILVANVLYGYPFDSENFSDNTENIPIIRIRDVKSGRASTYYSGDFLSAYVIRKGDILVGMDGEFNLAKWNDRDGLLNQRVLKVFSKDHNEILDGYLFHVLKPMFKEIENSISGSTVKHLSAKIINSMKILVPPLAVQEEIVRILDNFSELTAELKTQLAAELTARKKQYEYYRDELLTFDDSVEWKTLGEIAKLTAGGDVPKQQFSSTVTDKYNIPIISNGIGARAIYGYTNIAKITEPCVSIAARGTIGYCMLHKTAFYPIIRLICACPKTGVILPDFLKYFLDTIKFKVPESGIPQLTVPMVSKYKIPIPSLSEQQRIADMLDRFDALCNDISQGLPAEIEARQKQYEYYRDKLLSFSDSGVEISN